MVDMAHDRDDRGARLQVARRVVLGVQRLFDVGELNAAVGQEGVRRYIAMTCQTDDPEREAAHLEYVREIEPRLKPVQNAVREKYLDSPHRPGLPRDRYLVFDRALENRRALRIGFAGGLA